MTRLSILPRAYALPPLGDTLTRTDLVERLRLLWQLTPNPVSHRKTLELVIDALSLSAERLEILGETSGKAADDTQINSQEKLL